MDTEFINVFIQKQKSFIEELVAKNLILEAKVTIAEKVIADLTSKLEQSQAQITAADTKKVKASPNT